HRGLVPVRSAHHPQTHTHLAVLSLPCAHRDLPSFPTRRSSDLRLGIAMAGHWWHVFLARSSDRLGKAVRHGAREALIADSTPERSEEHTSELQSRENLVCRLLLEKKTRNRADLLLWSRCARARP